MDVLWKPSGWKWIAAPKGLLEIIAKRTFHGKSRCIADVSRTPNGKEGDAARIISVQTVHSIQSEQALVLLFNQCSY